VYSWHVNGKTTFSLNCAPFGVQPIPALGASGAKALRLQTIQHSISATQVSRFDYDDDPAGRIIQWDREVADRSWRYDPRGNRILRNQDNSVIHCQNNVLNRYFVSRGAWITNVALPAE